VQSDRYAAPCRHQQQTSLVMCDCDLFHIWCPQFHHCSSYNLKFSPFSPPNVYQARYLQLSPQDPLFPAGLPTHLAPSMCTSDSASADHVFIYKLNLLTYISQQSFLCCQHVHIAARNQTTHGPYLTWQMSPTTMSPTGIWTTSPLRSVANLCSCSILL